MVERPVPAPRLGRADHAAASRWDVGLEFFDQLSGQ